ncbi:MAG: dienelactone hydrolase family protein [Gemmatales bacterium]|nr:dienelactone hydrolase family protein [Gemmatales bacterium]MDW8221847.1 dienelactone hydrolase family protein [Gemmatales bacterium]
MERADEIRSVRTGQAIAIALAVVLCPFASGLRGAASDKAAQAGNWGALLQKPYEQLVPPENFHLPPLLQDETGRKIGSRAEWEKQRERLRQYWLQVLGQPELKRPDLAAKVVSTETLADHIRYLVQFVTEGEDTLRAYLLVPKNLKAGERRAAVVVFHPTTKDTLHEPVGLGQRAENAFALFLTQRGYVTLSPECYIMKGEGPKRQTELLLQRIPGWTGMGKMTWDASRCVDFLRTRPEVDGKRIACWGHSLGAKQVLYAMAFEPRYVAGVFSEGGIGLRMSNWADVWYLSEKIRPLIPQREHHQLLALCAPRPFLILAGNSADGDLSWFFIKEARTVYALYGATERIGLHNHRAGHRLPQEARDLAGRWLDYWLSPERSAAD